MSYNEQKEERPYISLLYIPQDMYLPDRIYQVYYSSPDSWEYVGYYEEKDPYTDHQMLHAFDKDGKPLCLPTKDLKPIDDLFQQAAYPFVLAEEERKAQQKSIRRKKDRNRQKGIDR